MTVVVIDASVVIKWATTEPLAAEATWLLTHIRLIAPELLIAECANVLWKKVRRGELDPETARLAGAAIARVDIELSPMRQDMIDAVRLAIALKHPAYDCLYLALALRRTCQFVTADAQLIEKINRSADKELAGLALALADAPATLAPGKGPV
ncbi:MAG: type II toxin-antitoxin system VapC family toxin [Parvularculaceae bacterium]